MGKLRKEQKAEIKTGKQEPTATPVSENIEITDKSEEIEKVYTKLQKPSKKKFLILVIVIVLVLALAAGFFCYFFVFKKSEGKSAANQMPDRGGMQIRMSEDMVSAAGVTTVGVVEETFDLDFIDTELYIEEIYVGSNDEVEAGTKVLKLSDESVAKAREELEDAFTEADLAYRAGVITYEQSKITNQYDYDLAVLKGQQAQEVYDETVADLLTQKEEAQEAIDDANEQLQEYTVGLANENAGYDEEYQVSYLWNKYSADLALLKDKVDEYGLAWENVTGSANGGGGENLSLIKSLYQEVDEEYNEWKSAKSDFESAVAEATYGQETLQLQMASLEAKLQDAENNYEQGLISAKADYDTAIAQSELAQDNYDTAMKKAEETLDSLQNAQEDAQENLSDFEERIGDGYLYTKSAGTILMVMARAESNLSENSVVLAYSNTDEMTVSVSVDQADINKLTVGEEAYVVIENDGNFSGSIISINPVSSSTSRTSITYTVTVQLDGDVSALSANQSATVMFGMQMPENGGRKDAEN